LGNGQWALGNGNLLQKKLFSLFDLLMLKLRKNYVVSDLSLNLKPLNLKR
jgi:hypothetical protein